MSRNRYPFHNETRPTRAQMEAAERRYNARVLAERRKERTARAVYCAAVVALAIAFFYGL